MDDYNVYLEAIDQGMDMLKHFRQELDDIRAHVNFDMYSLVKAVELEISERENKIEKLREELEKLSTEQQENQREIERFQNELQRLRSEREQLKRLEARCDTTGRDLLERWNYVCGTTDLLASEGYCEMGNYLIKLIRVCRTQLGENPVCRAIGGGDYGIIVLDSKKYQQTAEHIRRAINQGMPSIVTIERKGADDRREESLENTKIRKEYDRDEFPMAMFAEGGAGADVAYIDSKDNQGAGSTIRWQLHGIQDGTRVKIQII